MTPTEEFGPYLVYEQIGVGGMASVHRAETLGLAGFRRPVALKRMLPSVAGDATLVKSFIREARLASHLHHANVAQTYDLGKVGDVYFIAMELVPGRNLRVILKHCQAIAGPVPLAITLNILNQICDALDYAHNLCDETGQPLGIIHRDVSPANVIVSETGVVKLIDFGIAKASAAGMQTVSRTIKGKFGYMAPEYIGGRIDARADLFALGVIGYELLTNAPLFQGRDEMDTLNRVKDMRIDPPSRRNPGVPSEIDAIVMTALERDPDRRWQRATALRTALTTETKRLGLDVLDTQVVEWVDWAFRQTGREPLASATLANRWPAVAAEDPEPSAGESVTMVSTPRRPSASEPVQHPHTIKRQNTSPPRPVTGAPPLRASAPAAPTSAPSGARTAQQSTLTVGDSSILSAHSVSAVLHDLEVKSSISNPPPPGRSRAALWVVVALVLAAAAGGVVYFALPYFT